MSLERFLQNALSSWMNCDGPETDIVLSSRVRLVETSMIIYFLLFFHMMWQQK